MALMHVSINGEDYDTDADPAMPLLWVLRDVLGLTGTKFGCGQGHCGACTVHVDGIAARSCLTSLESVAGHAVTTIEGLGAGTLHTVQEAWLAERVVQCGYCQPGQIMAAAALLAATPHPSDEQISEVMSEILCRCGTYPRILKAVRRITGVGEA